MFILMEACIRACICVYSVYAGMLILCKKKPMLLLQLVGDSD